jgi:hypothetical protein
VTIAVAYWTLARALDERRARVVAGICTVATVLYGGAFVPIQYERIELEATAAPVFFSLLGEYLPATLDSDRPPSTARVQAAQRSAGCEVSEAGPIREGRPRRFDVSCTSEATVPLPLFSHPLHRVVQAPPGPDDRCDAEPDGGALTSLCWVTVAAGSTTVEVDPPGFWSMIRSAAALG